MWELLQSSRSSFNCGNYCKVQDLLLIVELLQSLRSSS
ncbi:hypothetical protein LEP1GSC186_0674 [Leptospira noguchii serovar Autumnalis str. ZUN142]|uniref:Uncharacterized protein n=1 Tax=Leptospira noguchii serovar Autumnalis str. ZUN142 TaxID=1085540 RepID=M6UDG5_9LEPT|nr:hypothetical protein LEP1GSC186_0674 [Leptospira noguchii serovar Autumnalis str. ZUN142]